MEYVTETLTFTFRDSLSLAENLRAARDLAAARLAEIMRSYPDAAEYEVFIETADRAPVARACFYV